jgi:RNA polymerase sigma-70 factor (ECF subfamily)
VTPLFRSASTAPFDKLYEQHAASVYRYARAVLGNHADAEDVTQQTFLNAYRSLAQGTKPRKPENWIITIAHNEVRRHLRDTRVQRQEVELDIELADRPQERPEPGVHDVLRALQHLTPNQRSVLVMREFEGRSYAEISEIMGISQSALETLMFRARRSLADALEDGLTCAEAELAVSRRLDGRISRREARRLKKHVRECQVCKAFALGQRRQRSLLNGLSVIPVPASLLVFRGEQAAAAVGGSAAVGSAAAVGGSAGIAAKVAAVAAAVTVVGGVGYTAGKDHLPVARGHDAAGPALAAAAPAARVADKTAVVSAPRRVVHAPIPAAVHVQRPKAKPAPTSHARGPAKAKSQAVAKAKATRKAEKIPARPERSHPATKPVQAKSQRATPTRRRPVHEPKPNEPTKRPTTAKRAVKPAPKAELPPAPAVVPAVVPPGLEKKLLEPKPEKSKPLP